MNIRKSRIYLRKNKLKMKKLRKKIFDQKIYINKNSIDLKVHFIKTFLFMYFFYREIY